MKYHHLLSKIALCLVFLFCVTVSEAAVYSSGQSNKSNITDLYREMVVVDAGESLYTANNFNGGYIGLAGSPGTTSDHFVNFSIWDNGQGDLNYVVEGPDPELGGSVERFGNEGTGAKTTTKLRWEFNVLYKTYVKVEFVEGGSLFSGWINRADSSEWYLCGRIFVPNMTRYVGTGTVFLETLSDHECINGGREIGATLGWVRNSSGWAAMTGLAWHCQTSTLHTDRASGYNTSTVHYLTFDQDNRAPWYPATWYQVPPGMVPTPSTAPDTMAPYDGPIVDISACLSGNEISKTNWTLHYVDSQETTGEDGAAVNAFDDDPSTIWHTQWWGGSPPHPHEIQIDLGTSYSINAFSYLPREGSSNGNIDEYEFYISTNGSNWANPISTGSWGGITGMCNSDTFPAVTGRYIRLVALSEINQNPWTSAAEINVYEALPAPTGLTATPGDNTVSLQWDDTPGAAGYHVYRSESENGPYSQIAGGLLTSDYIDNTAVNCNVYFYYVTAADGSGGQSAYSAPAYASLRPKGDLTGDCLIKLADFALFAQNWLDSDCWYCNGADLNNNGQVDIIDLQTLAGNWLE